MSAGDIGATLANASRLGSNAGILLHALEHRAALAVLELEEAGERFSRALIASVVSASALLLAAGTLTLLVAAVFWDTPYRVLALGLLATLHLATAGVAAWFTVTTWRRLRVFTDLREQLTKDCACLRDVLTPQSD